MQATFHAYVGEKTWRDKTYAALLCLQTSIQEGDTCVDKDEVDSKGFMGRREMQTRCLSSWGVVKEDRAMETQFHDCGANRRDKERERKMGMEEHDARDATVGAA